MDLTINTRVPGLTVSSVPDQTNGEEIWSAIKVDGDGVRCHLDELVPSTVEDTLNQMLDAEADQLCGAKRYEGSAERLDSRAGSYAGSCRRRRVKSR